MYSRNEVILMSHILEKNHVKSICKIGQGSTTCSFLVLSGMGFECIKGTIYQANIAERRAAGTMNAKSDNCSGPPHFTPHKTIT